MKSGIQKLSFRSAYTLIEVMIAIAIIGIMSAGGYPRLTTFSQEVRLQEEAKIIYNDLCLLQQASITAGTGTGTFNLIGTDSAGIRIGIGYDLWDSFGRYLRPSFRDATWTRDLGMRNVCISPITFPASATAPFVHPIDFSRLGLPSTNFRLNVRYYETESNRVVEQIGTWSITVDPQTMRLILTDETSDE